jgi:hypothetical protein
MSLAMGAGTLNASSSAWAPFQLVRRRPPKVARAGTASSAPPVPGPEAVFHRASNCRIRDPGAAISIPPRLSSPAAAVELRPDTVAT